MSICITTFNMEKFIEKSLNSILMQVIDFNIEIVISDDASTDNTLKISREYKRRFPEIIHIIESPTNTGVILTLKRAIDACSSKYIAILDADDYWIMDTKLQKQFNLLEQDNNIGFVYTNFRYIDEYGNYGQLGINSNFIPPIKCNFIHYLLSPYISPSCIVFRKELINFNIFKILKIDKYASQEYALFLDLTSKSYGYFLDEPTMVYTVRQESLSRKKSYKEKIKTSYSSFETANKFIQSHPIPNNVNKIRVFKFYLKVLLTSWESMNFNIIKKFTTKLTLFQFLKYNPKATYIYIASKNKYLYRLFRPWVLRKRPPGK